ncbi:hypothetical protein [Enterococcus mundtii]|uniref:hypothetical protein n=1 Tax=Enterococcus mundtii TaxID=53346 RepID=UPI00397110C7
MDQNRDFSNEVYKVKHGEIELNTKIGEKQDYLVINTIDTNKDTIGNECTPKKNSTQAMVVAELKDRYKTFDNEDLKKVQGFPDSVITKNLTIAYAGTTSVKDWHTNIVEIGLSNKHPDGVFFSALNYAHEVSQVRGIYDFNDRVFIR